MAAFRRRGGVRAVACRGHGDHCMIVQELRAIQDRRGYLPEADLRAASERLDVPLHRLHEVATYFPHFRMQPPPAVTVSVCRDMACHLRGSQSCRRELEALARELGANRVHVEGVSCVGRCDGPVAVVINDHVYSGKSPEEVKKLIRAAASGEPLPRQHESREPPEWKIDPYRGQPRYDVIRQFVSTWTSDAEPNPQSRRRRVGEPFLNAIKSADLRGMGGAGFRTHIKWSTVRDEPEAIKYIVGNGDESEPGAFKDRELLRRLPWLLVEGMVIAGLVTGAERGWIFIRHEYEEEIEVVREAIVRAEKDGFCGSKILGSKLSFPLEVYVSPGGYICGEESALLEAMEDRRAEPRNKPPLLFQEGLFGKPTVVNNIETFSWIPAIVLQGSDWYRSLGTNGATGMRLVSISGDVQRPGVYEVPMGQTARELVFDTAGGMREGMKLKALATSGPSGGFLPAVLEVANLPQQFVDCMVKRGRLKPGATTIDMLDVPFDFDAMSPFPDFMLGAACIVYGDHANMLEQALICTQFYRNESCGKCVPCRLGSQKLAELISEIVEGRFHRDLGLIDELSDAMLVASICGLGRVAPNPMRSVMKHFRADLDVYLNRGRV